jgi:Uma2 family endonuclease
MNEKDLEKGRGKDITYKADLETPIISESRADYKVAELDEYKKFQKLPDTMRVEFTDGKIYYLAAPNNKHQELLMRLSLRFGNYLHGKSCKVYAAPFDVKIDFDFDKQSKETVQPDLLVICDDEKLGKKGLNGVPDLVIEILSPSDPGRDKVFKYNKYLAVSVKEYWIVDPIREEVLVNVLNAGRYDLRIYQKGDMIKPTVLGGLHVNVTDLFEGREGRETPEVEEVRVSIAKSLLSTGMDVEEVEKHTGLSKSIPVQL